MATFSLFALSIDLIFQTVLPWCCSCHMFHLSSPVAESSRPQTSAGQRSFKAPLPLNSHPFSHETQFQDLQGPIAEEAEESEDGDVFAYVPPDTVEQERYRFKQQQHQNELQSHVSDLPPSVIASSAQFHSSHDIGIPAPVSLIDSEYFYSNRLSNMKLSSPDNVRRLRSPVLASQEVRVQLSSKAEDVGQNSSRFPDMRRVSDGSGSISLTPSMLEYIGSDSRPSSIK